MAEQKTKPIMQPVEHFVDQLSSEQLRSDCQALIRIMTKATGAPPVMWGAGIVGFGKYHYRYESGHEGDACLTGFSPRKTAITLYIMPPQAGHGSLLDKLGKFKAGKGCLYVKKLDDINTEILEKLVSQSVSDLQFRYKQ